MGTFAGLFVSGTAGIPDSKRDEFSERIEKLYQAGGMMEVNDVELFGTRVVTIRKAAMRENGMDFYYNYFEDDYWENAGFDRENGKVYSEKIGWSYFHRAVVAAYVLEEIYTNGIASAMVNEEPVISWGYVGWINYLFHERYHIKNYDKWKLFEAFHEIEDRDMSYINWNRFVGKRYELISTCEIWAVLYGTDEALEKFDNNLKKEEDVGYIAIDYMKEMKKALLQYKENRRENEETQLNFLLGAIRAYYENEEEIKESEKEAGERNSDEALKKIITCLKYSDAPAFAMKVVAEMYDMNFWDVWNRIKDIAKRKMTELYGNQDYYIMPITTKEFFGQLPDDMIPYWEEDCDIEFSEDLWGWFRQLKDKYQMLMQENDLLENPLKYIIELMKYADDNYYHIYTFTDFFEESAEHLTDKRYQALWRLYGLMLHAPKYEKAGSVIFVPTGPEYEHMGLHYLGEQPKRRLSTSWEIMEDSKRNNIARVNLRRYMALVANKSLRKRVFGF